MTGFRLFLVTVLLSLLATPVASGAVPPGNLLVNGSAEADAGAVDPDCGPDVAVSGWTEQDFHLTVLKYGGLGLPLSGDGAQFFAGGCMPPEEGNTTIATQSVSINSIGAAAEVDAGIVVAHLSALLGGFEDEDDDARVSLSFFGANVEDLGSPGYDLHVGPVLRADRGDETKMLARTGSRAVPPGTRTLVVTIVLRRFAGARNDGYADKIDLSLTTDGTPPAPGDPVPDQPIAPPPGPPPPPDADTRRPTGASMRCDRGPTLRSDSTCMVLVADAGPPVRTAPGGTVRWKITGEGSLPRGDTCRLARTLYGPGISGCEVVFRPGPSGTPGGTEIPVVATYEGSPVFLPVSVAHRLLDAMIVDPTTGERAPSDSDCAAAARRADTRTTALRASQYYRDPETDPSGRPTGYQEPLFDTVTRNSAWCVSRSWNGLKQGGGVLVSLGGLAYTGTSGVVFGAMGGTIAKAPGAAAAGSFGLVAGWQNGGSQIYSAGGEILDAAGRAVADPPDPKFRVLVRPKKVRTFSIRGGRSRASKRDARDLRRWTTAIRRVRATSRAFSATADKAGGAREAGDAKWEGRQMRQAVRLARQLIRELVSLRRENRVIARRALSSREARRLPSLRMVSRQRRRLASQGLRRSERRSLEALGVSAADVRELRRMARKRSVSNRQLVRAPAQAVRRATRDPMWLDAERFFRLWVVHPEVVAAARLGL
jgi:hypothetical protein